MMTAFKSHWKALPAGVIYEDFNTLVVHQAIKLWEERQHDVGQPAMGIFKLAGPFSSIPP